MIEYNNCDCCNKKINSNDLVWIGSEDFEPRKGEYVTVEMYKNYEALCEECYLRLVEPTISN